MAAAAAQRRECYGDTGTGTSTQLKATSMQFQLQGNTTMRRRLGLWLMRFHAAVALRNGTSHTPSSH